MQAEAQKQPKGKASPHTKRQRFKAKKAWKEERGVTETARRLAEPTGGAATPEGAIDSAPPPSRYEKRRHWPRTRFTPTHFTISPTQLTSPYHDARYAL